MNILRSFLFALLGMAWLAHAAHAAEPVWAPIAEKMVQALTEGESLYKANDSEAAQKKVQGVYFSIFEAEKFEAAMEKGLGKSHTESVEKAFGKIRKSMKSKAPQEEVTGMVQALIKTLREDAGKLDAAGVTRPADKSKK
ncbi:MAG: hypothetical protein HQL88_10790 [Magnetococcales bacterium]|nr:hypothetical protein [Magnetococcales bacterium]